MTNTTTYIIVGFSVPGLHRWVDAKLQEPEVAYLSDLHRHVFTIQLKKVVSHDDRQIEFIILQRKIKQYLSSKYFDGTYNCLNFDTLSCEHLAKELLLAFDADYVSVLEDESLGAEVFKG